MNRIKELKSIVEQGKFPSDHEHFGGAGLIITNDPEYKGYPEDVVVFTIHAGTLSWLVFQLKSIYNDRIDYMNKYFFYPAIGETLNQSLNKGEDLSTAMLKVIEEVQKVWESK